MYRFSMNGISKWHFIVYMEDLEPKFMSGHQIDVIFLLFKVISNFNRKRSECL